VGRAHYSRRDQGRCGPREVALHVKRHPPGLASQRAANQIRTSGVRTWLPRRIPAPAGRLPAHPRPGVGRHPNPPISGKSESDEPTPSSSWRGPRNPLALPPTRRQPARCARSVTSWRGGELDFICSCAIVVRRALVEQNCELDEDAARVLRRCISDELAGQIERIDLLLRDRPENDLDSNGSDARVQP
jgi:hypothetical protein